MMNNKNTAKKMSINENAILEKYLNTLATPISKHKPDKNSHLYAQMMLFIK